METLDTTAPATETSGSNNSNPPAFGEYWPGQGGIYGGIMPSMDGHPARHLVFSTEAPDRLTWGPYGTAVAEASSRSDGRANTAAILAHKATKGDVFPAAEWAAAFSADGHQDFHLPSQAELFMAALYAPKAFNPNHWHWSSTQTSADFACVQGFEDGTSGWHGKDNGYRVRAVRWIPL